MIIQETGYHRRDEELERLDARSASTAEVTVVAAPVTASSRAPAAATAFSFTFSFPPPLIDAYRRSKLAILFGSGLSIARDVVGDFPRWDALPSRLLDQAMKHGVWSQAQIEARRAIFAGGSMSLGQMLTDLDGIKA